MSSTSFSELFGARPSTVPHPETHTAEIGHIFPVTVTPAVGEDTHRPRAREPAVSPAQEWEQQEWGATPSEL